LGVISPKNKEFYPQDTLKTLFLYNYPYDCKSDWVFRGCLKFEVHKNAKIVLDNGLWVW